MKNILKKHQAIKIILPLFLFAVLIFLYLFPTIYRGQAFLYGDNLSHQLPTLTFFKQEIMHGRLPLWNPYILSGVPYLADPTHNTFAPTNIFYMLFPIHVGMTINIYIYLFLAAVFTYLYVKSVTNNQLSALIGGIIFTFSGSVLSEINDLNSLQGIALIPLVIYFTMKLVKKNSLSNLFMLVVVMALQVFSSHFQYVYYTWMLMEIYYLVMSKESLKNNIKTLLSIGLLVALLTSIQLIPFFEFILNAYRPTDKSFTSQDQLMIVEIPRMVLANLYGSWRDGSSWGPNSQLETGLANTKGYIGIFPLCIVLLAILKKKSKQSKFWLLSIALTFLISFGGATPLHPLLQRTLPFYSFFRAPIRILSIYSFSTAVVVGLFLAGNNHKNNNE